MALSNGTQMALFAIALFLIGIGAIGAAVKDAGFPPVVSFGLLIAGIAGAAIERAYGLGTGSPSVSTARRIVAEADARAKATV